MTIITIKTNGKISRVHYAEQPRKLTKAHAILAGSLAVMLGVFIWATIGDQISERIEAQLYEDRV